jgi:hypothetical protein
VEVRISPLEGTGFEPSVPLQEKWSKFQRSDPEGRDIELSVSPKDICASPVPFVHDFVAEDFRIVLVDQRCPRTISSSG